VIEYPFEVFDWLMQGGIGLESRNHHW